MAIKYSKMRNDIFQISRLYPDGFLVLEGDPDDWIRSNPDQCQSVLSLELKFRDLKAKKIDGVSKLDNLQRLLLDYGTELEELPENLGDLGSLTYLSLQGCSRIKTLPNSICKMSNLTELHLNGCNSIKELPANLGELSDLLLLDIRSTQIMCLPRSIAKLSNLSLLFVPFDFRLQTLPTHLNDSVVISVGDIIVDFCKTWRELKAEIHLFGTPVRFWDSKTKKEKIQVSRLYPDGFLFLDRDPDDWILSNNLDDCLSVLSLEMSFTVSRVENIDSVSKLLNVQRLLIYYCNYLQELPANLGDLESLTYLSLQHCSSIKWLPNSIGKLSNLTVLHLYHCESLVELPVNLGELYNLSLLNIQSTQIKWLPWSIAKLSKLSLLLLPEYFRLETLPGDLIDSVVISVESTFVRKTWREFKTEIDLPEFIPIVGAAEAGRSGDTPKYVAYDGHPGPWIQEKGLCFLVQFLDLNLDGYKCEETLSNYIAHLPMLTHLYISSGCLCHLPVTPTKITHLSLSHCNVKCGTEPYFLSLEKLSTLQTLQILNCRYLPEHIDLPVSLTHLTLQRSDFVLFPDSYVASFRKLSNLKSLVLLEFDDLDLSMFDFNLVKLKIFDCSIKSLPADLRHLEIIHSSVVCFEFSSSCDELLLSLCNLVNLETLSVTCRQIQYIPSIEGLLSLQKLYLKDCFNLRKLPPNMDKLINLHTINLSGTRINYLPDSFTSPQNLQQLILPKCFAFKSLSQNYVRKVTVDEIDDFYYEEENYNDSSYDSSEDSELTWGSIEEDDGVDLQESEHETSNEQASLDRPINPIPNATQRHEDSLCGGATDPIDNSTCSRNHERHALSKDLDVYVPLTPHNIPITSETDGQHIPNNISQFHTDPNGFGVNENNPQVQPMEMFPSSAENPNSSLQEPTLNESNNVQAFPNRETDDMEIEQRIASANSSENPIHDRGDEHALEHKRKKTHKIEIPRETLEELMSQGITIEEAAKKLGVIFKMPKPIGRATVVRSLKEKGMSWPRPKITKQHESKNSRRTVEEPSLETQCQGDSQQVEENPNAANEGTSSNTEAQPDGSPSTFVVIATPKKPKKYPVRFDFSLRSSIEQLKNEVATRLELKIGKFKMLYRDEDKRLVLMAHASDLKHAWDHASHASLSRSGKRVVELFIV